MCILGENLCPHTSDEINNQNKKEAKKTNPTKNEQPTEKMDKLNRQFSKEV
jgi:hypothetical protein